MIKNYIGIGILTILIIMAIMYGFSSTGSPFQIRAQKFDAQRVTDITNLKYQVDNYYTTNGHLPNSIGDLSKSSYNTGSNKDPETGKGYELKRVADSKYQICATFSTSSKDMKYSTTTPYSIYGNLYEHPKGYYCFDFSAPAVYNAPYRAPSNSSVPTSSSFTDSNILSVTSDATGIVYSNFPYGLFSTDDAETGLINYVSKPVTITIELKTPQKIKDVASTFINCQDANCYKWSAKGIRDDGTEVILGTDVKANENIISTIYVTSTEKFSKLVLTATRLKSFNNLFYVHWKKIYIDYAT